MENHSKMLFWLIFIFLSQEQNYPAVTKPIHTFPMALHVVVPSPMEKTFSLWREGGATRRLNGPVVNNYCGLGNTERKQSSLITYNIWRNLGNFLS